MLKETPAAPVVDYLIIGGGPAGATAASALRREGATGSITILSAEDMAPYHRQRLSKGFLVGASSASEMLVYPLDFYAENKIDLRLGVRVARVDTKQRQVHTAAGEVLRYGQMLLAPGTVPRRSSVPGNDLAGIYYLRQRADADAIRAAAQSGRKAVVLGASYLGMEVAFSLQKLGLSVTLIEVGPRVLPFIQAPEISAFFETAASQRGIAVRLNDTAERFTGAGHIEAVETRNGETLPADMVVLASGVVPATEFLRDSGVTLDEKGFIQADAMLRTSAVGVFAAGDALDFYDSVFACRRNVEHWDNAVRQGHLAARNMLGRRQRYDEVSYFYCEIGDLAFDVLGMPEAGRAFVSRGTLDERSFALLYLADDVPKALFSLGRSTTETRLAEGLIRYRVNIANHIAPPGGPELLLDEVAAQTVLVLQGGGALGAFECGVVKALESENIFADVVAGVSIGALNGAIIAANPRRATEALESFWRELTIASPPLPFADLRQAAVAGQILMFGVPNFFKPRWMPPFEGTFGAWTSFYDVSPMRRLITRYVDFKALKSSPVRLLVGAVDVAAGRLEVFDSYVDDLTPDHVLASGSLPPGFPWSMVDGKAYWDGGVVSNSPLDLVTDRIGQGGKQVYIVDLFSGNAPLPGNLMEVLARRDEIVYAERIHNDLRVRELSDAYREMLSYILQGVDPEARRRVEQHPRFIQLMGDEAATYITRFQRPRTPGEPSSRDYDFSSDAIARHQAEGYELVKKTLAGARRLRSPDQPAPPSVVPAGPDQTGSLRQQIQAERALYPTKGRIKA
jgi:NADPH-dependent 2,4-dienoyl-CoA reductase/sulfur reductase-like enzyme/predicted acylesterase/phospholipase RssA